MLNSTTFVPANLYNNLAPMIGGGAAAVTESPLPYCNSQVGDVVFQHLAKSMNCYSFNNPPLKDDSGLSFNYNALPLPRKRPRLADIDNCEDGSVSILNDEMYIQMMQQQLEIDRLISIHMEKVRQEMEDRRRKQSNRVIQSIQEAVSRKLKEKEDQIEKIGKLNWALENRIKSLCVENQIWRDLAQTNEATANALRLNLEQVILSQSNNNNATVDPATEDAESCCGSSGHDEDDGGGVLRWRKVQGERKRICKRCGESESNVLVLPCRHLCLCAACGPAVETCPICNSAKTATVHVNLC